MSPLRTAPLLAVMLLACGPGDGPGGDAGADAGEASDTGVDISAPDIPWLEEGIPPIAPPLLTPCPEGWHEVIEVDPDGGMDVVTCDPYGTDPGGTVPDTCLAGQAHFTGDPGCTPVGAPCPSGDFPEGLPSDAAILYVLAGAAPGGDGSEAAPLSTITGGLALASPGTIVAIGKGEYDEALRLPPGVTLWGACAAQTRLTASTWGPLAQGIITVPSADTRVANLWVGPADLPGIVAYGERTSLSLDGVVIDGVRTVGLWMVRGAQMEGRELVVSRTRANTAGHFGRGVLAHVASTVDLRRAWISENRDVGVFASDEGTSLTLSDVVIRDTQPQQSNGTGGWGLNVEQGAAATVMRTLLTRNRDVGVYVYSLGTSLTLSDVVIRDTQPQESDDTGGRGLNLQLGATATVTRALLSRNRELAIFADGDDTSLSLSDVVIRDTQAQESDGAAGRGLGAQRGPVVTVTRAVLSRNREMGVYASEDGTSMALSDVVIRDTQARESDGTGGRGLGVQMGASATVTRALVSRNHQAGVLAHSMGTDVQLLDVLVTQTDEQDCADTTCRERPLGMGLVGTSEASLSAARFAVHDGPLCGVMVAHDAQVDLAVGEVSGFQIGVCLQVDGYSVPRLTDHVRYVNNETNLDTTSLPVPELASLVD